MTAYPSRPSPVPIPPAQSSPLPDRCPSATGQVNHHLISMELDDVPLPGAVDRAALEGRSMVVTKTDVVPIECVVRGYLSGSGWKEYPRDGLVCGIALTKGSLPDEVVSQTREKHIDAYDLLVGEEFPWA